MNPPDSYHLEAKQRLTSIWFLDADLGDAVARLPWLEDGVDFEQSFALRHMAHLANADLNTARMAASLGWFVDEPTVWETQSIRWLSELAHIDHQLPGPIVDLPWFRDGIEHWEDAAIKGLNLISSVDLALARRILHSSWFADAISKKESSAIRALGEIALRDPELASYLGEYAIDANGDLVLDVISTILRTMDVEDDSWVRLAGQPWFADGLDNEELALVAVLGRFVRRHPQLYKDLIQTPFTQSATVSLPLVGEVNLFVIQPKPFHHSQEDVLPMLEDSVQITEEFMGVPFPVTDVILVVPIVGPEVDHGIGGGRHWGEFITVTRYETSPPHDIWLVTDWEAIYHEVAHYYFEGGFGPPWLVEGGAEFMWMYIREERAGTGDIENQHPGAVLRLQENCYSHGIRSLQQLNELQSSEPDLETICHYSLGAYFLLSLYTMLGEEATSAALRELYLLFRETGDAQAVTEEEIYQAFLRNTPLGLEDEFLALYRQFHTPDFMAEEAEPA